MRVIFLKLGLLFIVSCTTVSKSDENFKFPINSPIIEILINNEDTAYFLIDTGSGLCLMDSSFYSKNKYSFDASETNLSAPNVSGIYSGLNFSFEGVFYEEYMFAVSDLKKVKPYIDGILGKNFLFRKRLLLDYKNRKVKFLLSESMDHFDLPMDSIPFDLSLNVPIINATIKVSDSLMFSGKYIIDTGMDNEITLKSATAEAFDLDSVGTKNLELKRLSGTIYGDIAAGITRAKNFSFANITFENALVAYERYDNKLNQSKAKKFDIDGLIGNRILAKFVIILDYQKQMLYFYPHNELSSQDFYSSGISLGKSSNGGLLIAGLIYNTPADSAGIRIGDILLEVDGIKASEATYIEISNKLITPHIHNLKLKRNDSIFEKQVPVKKLL